jgi:outer membrane protein TolC
MLKLTTPAQSQTHTHSPAASLIRGLLSGCWIVGLAALGLCGASCSPEPAPFDAVAAQRLERLSASSPEQRPMRPLPTTLENDYIPVAAGEPQPPHYPPATGPSFDVGPEVRIPLRELAQRAVANNYDVRVAGFQPAIDANRIIEAEANFDPAFFSDLSFQRDDNRAAGVLDSLTSTPTVPYDNRDLIDTADVGVKQNLVSGGSISLRYTAQQTQYSPQRYVPEPYMSSDLVLSLTQPLLQNFGADVNRAQITIAQQNRRISLLEFRKQVETTLRDLETAYWQLVDAERGVKIDEQLLSETINTANILERRLGQDVTRVQLAQANAFVQTRRATLIRSKAHVRDLSDQIKRIINDPELPISSGTLILPADSPLEEPVHFDLPDQVNTALQNRYELGEQQLKIDQASTYLMVARNFLLPQLNFVGSLGTQGLAGDFGEAIEGQGHVSYSAGLQFSVPIGNRDARAIYRRTVLSREQAMTQYQSDVEQVTLDVKIAMREVQTTWDEMYQRRRATFAQADSLLALQQREEGGEPLTPTFVQLKLDTQGDLAQARHDESTAISNYNVAIASLEFAKGTILRYNNVVLEEDKLSQLIGQ